jgi:hypothetical protein
MALRPPIGLPIGGLGFPHQGRLLAGIKVGATGGVTQMCRLGTPWRIALMTPVSERPWMVNSMTWLRNQCGPRGRAGRAHNEVEDEGRPCQAFAGCRV